MLVISVLGVKIMGIFDKVNDASRGISEKAKGISELGNLKRKILYEEERIVEIFADIGKLYYKGRDENLDEITVLCTDVDTRRRRIKKLKMEFYNIKGFKICPDCGAEVIDKFKFCNVCGAKILTPEDEDFFYDEIDTMEKPSLRKTILEVNPSSSI